MKTIKIISLILVAYFVGYFFGSNNIYMAADVYSNGTQSVMYPHFYNIKKALKFESEYSNALLEGLHRFYSNDDNDFWFESFVGTKEYQKIDSLNQGDWEDFYYYETPMLENWVSVYGTDLEPSEEYKAKVQWGLSKVVAKCPDINTW